MLTIIMLKPWPVDTKARRQGHRNRSALPHPGIFCCAKAQGLYTHFGAKAPGFPGMVTGQSDTRNKLLWYDSSA